MKLPAIILAATLLTSCKGSTEYGDCVGINGKQKPEYQYEISMRNAILAAVLVETIIVPVLWYADYAYCPVGKKEDK
jgi:hypothetical protein